MGVCCQNQRTSWEVAEDTPIVVVGTTDFFDKNITKQMKLFKQSKTEEVKVITIKQLKMNPREHCEKTLIIARNTIMEKGRTTGKLFQLNLFNNGDDSSNTESSPNKSPEIVSINKKKKPKKKMQVTDYDITTEEMNHIKNIFHNLFIFDSLTDDVIDLILGNLFLLEVSEDHFLYEEGFLSQFFYIVMEGTLEVYKDNQLIKTYNKWDSFGHDSLITNDHSIPLEDSVKCVTYTKLFVLNGESFISIQRRLIKLKLQERYDFINTIIFFKALDSIIKHNIAEKMNLVTFEKGEKIISQGEAGNNIYMIKDGSVSCQINNQEVKQLGVSKYFGIVSLLKSGKRTLDVISKEKCVCFELTINDLTEAIGTNYIESILFSIFKEFLLQNEYFSDLITEKNAYEVFAKFCLKSYEKNENIYYKKTSGKTSITNKRIIIVIEGNFVNNQTMKIQYKTGGVIGEDMVKNCIDIPENLIAYPDCLTLEANVDNITQLLGEDIHANTLNIQNKVLKLQEFTIFHNCSVNILKQIVLNINKKKYKQGTIIIQEETPGDFFYIISKGKVEVSILDRPVRILETNSFFGELSIINTQVVGLHTATVKAITDVNCLVINQKDFLSLANDRGVSELLCRQMSLQDSNINLSDLRFIQHLGKGKFGSVDLVHNNNYVYAIKAIHRKDADTKKRMARYLQEERKLLLCVDHPFICKIVKTFKNEHYVFLLLEYINGQNITDFLDTHQILINMNDVQFIIASILLVIDYLHKKRIVHRDIKPNNIILDSKGYIKLVDFGAAKILTDYTNTIIGTPHYMSPEILNGKGYSYSCDYWSIGVCAFELFFKKYPFGNEAHEIMEIYKEILYSKYKLPFVNNMFAPLNQFLSEILEKQVTKRICSLRKIKNMSFFDNLNWDQLIEYKIESCFKPKSINFNQLNINQFTIPYEEYMIKNMDIIFNNQNNPRNYEQEIKDTQWAEEFSM